MTLARGTGSQGRGPSRPPGAGAPVSAATGSVSPLRARGRGAGRSPVRPPAAAPGCRRRDLMRTSSCKLAFSGPSIRGRDPPSGAGGEPGAGPALGRRRGGRSCGTGSARRLSSPRPPACSDPRLEATYQGPQRQGQLCPPQPRADRGRRSDSLSLLHPLSVGDSLPGSEARPLAFSAASAEIAVVLGQLLLCFPRCEPGAIVPFSFGSREDSRSCMRNTRQPAVPRVRGAQDPTRGNPRASGTLGPPSTPIVYKGHLPGFSVKGSERVF